MTLNKTFYFRDSDFVTFFHFDGDGLSSVRNIPCKNIDCTSILKDIGYTETTIEEILDQMHINQVLETYHSLFLKIGEQDYKEIPKNELFKDFISNIISKADIIQQTEKYLPMSPAQKMKLKRLLLDLISSSKSIPAEIHLPVFAYVNYTQFERQTNPKTEIKIKTDCGIWKEAMSELKSRYPFNAGFEYDFCYSPFIKSIIL